ncbi:MAG: hypothetical protein ACR2OU_09225 [Thermomicrobiales bacterium]
MRSNSRNHHPTDADRVDALWDRINDTNTQEKRSKDPSEHSDDTLDCAAISLLSAIVPTAEEESLARIRQTFEAGITKETGMGTLTHRASASGTLPRPTQIPSVAPRRLRHVPRAMNRIAAAVLVLAVIGSVLLAGPGRGLVPEGVEHQLAALPGFSSRQDDNRPEEGGMVAIGLTPSTAPYSPMEVGVWELTLPVGTGIQLPPLSLFGSAPFAFYVISGTVGAGSALPEAYEHFVGAGDGMSLANGWEYVRNVNPSPATIWVIAPFPWDVGAGFNFHCSPWNPSSDLGGTPEKTGNTGAIQMRELMRVPVSIADGNDVGVTLGLYKVAPGATFTDLLSYGTRSIHVLDGQFDVSKTPTSGTAVPVTTIRQGQNRAVSTDSPHQAYKATGSESLRILTVSVAPAIDSFISTPSPQPKLPQVTEWTGNGG